MATRPQRPCRNRICRAIHRNANGYCDAHQKDLEGWSRTSVKSATARGYDHEWRKLRKRIMDRDRWLCQVCIERGSITEAQEVDHIVGKAAGGDDAPDNLQAICKPCHRVKTAFESAASKVGLKRFSLYPEWLEPARCDLTIIFGPPGSGKSHYINENATKGDMVIDLDIIRSNISGTPIYQSGSEWLGPSVYCRNEVLGSLSKRKDLKKVWFATLGRTESIRNWWQEILHPSEVITMDTSKEECIRRIKEDDRRVGVQSAHIKAVMDWDEE